MDFQGEHDSVTPHDLVKTGEDPEYVWESLSGDQFVFTKQAVYTPVGVGVRNDKRIPYEDVVHVEVTENRNPNYTRSGIVLLIGVVLAMVGGFIGDAIGVITLVGGLLTAVSGGLMLIKENQTTPGTTCVTIRVEGDSTSVFIEGLWKAQILDVLQELRDDI